MDAASRTVTRDHYAGTQKITINLQRNQVNTFIVINYNNYYINFVLLTKKQIFQLAL